MDIRNRCDTRSEHDPHSEGCYNSYVKERNPGCRICSIVCDYEEVIDWVAHSACYHPLHEVAECLVRVLDEAEQKNAKKWQSSNDRKDSDNQVEEAHEGLSENDRQLVERKIRAKPLAEPDERDEHRNRDKLNRALARKLGHAEVVDVHEDAADEDNNRWDEVNKWPVTDGEVKLSQSWQKTILIVRNRPFNVSLEWWSESDTKNNEVNWWNDR